MLGLGNYMANLLFGTIPEPIDWEAKRRSDEQRLAVGPKPAKERMK